MGLVEKGLFKEHYTLVSDIVRVFIGRKNGFDAMEMTTREVLSLLSPRLTLGQSIAPARDFLEDCDLVKFSKYVPGFDEAGKIIPRARKIVDGSAWSGNVL